MLKRLIKSLAYRFYVAGKFEADQAEAKQNQEKIAEKAVVGSRTKITAAAIVQNDTGDRSRICIGADCEIRGYLLVYNHGGFLRIGDYCFIGADTKIWCARKIEIGNRVLISHNVNIHDNNSHSLDPLVRHQDFIQITTAGLAFENDLNEKDVIIGDDVWIGFNATILKGVRIGKGAIVGACTLVTKDVPDYAVVIGNPARIVKYLVPESNSNA